MRVDHYEILGVSSSASPEDIKKAFRRLVKDLHPDRLPSGLEKENSEKRLKQIIASYKYLSHRQSRQKKQLRYSANTSITKSFLQNKYLLDLSFYLQDTYQSAIAPHFQKRYFSNLLSSLKGQYQSAIAPFFQHKFLLDSIAYCKGKYRTIITPHFQNEFWLVTFPNFIDKLFSKKLRRVWSRIGAPAIVIGAIFTYGLLGVFIIMVLVAMSPSW